MSVGEENDAGAGTTFVVGSLVLVAGITLLALVVMVLSRTHYCGENNPYGSGSTVWDACNLFGDFGVYVPLFAPPALVTAGGALAVDRERWRPLVIGCGLALIVLAVPALVLVIAATIQGPGQTG